MTCNHAHDSYPTLNYGTGAKWIKNLTKDRLSTFNGGHFSDVNLSSMLFLHRLENDSHVKLEVWSAPGLSKPLFEEAMKQKFKPAKKGQSFGPSWTNHWWKVSVRIPSYWEQYERVQFEFDPGCEAMIYTVDGVPLQGITGGYGGDRRVEYIIPGDAVKKGKHEFVIESSCNGMFGVPWNGDTIAPPDMNRYFQLASADLVVPNQEAWHLLWDFQTLREIADSLPGNTSLQNKALTVANEIMNVFQKDDVSSIARARKLAEEVFGEGWAAKNERIYEEGVKKGQIWGIGHCHIDTAWLWPYRVTQQKVARSWSTQVDLMDRYPEHRFTCSQAQQYKWLEQLYPPLFERVKAKILEGKFHPVGGSWVENDSNMPSGEALARQFIFGQRYFESRFGQRCKTAWLPDSFGLTGALPQLIRLADMEYFFTQKLSWNNINVFPHSTFNWVGIDGTQVLCHMTPVDTYTAQATVGDVNKGLTNHKNIESSDISLLVFGNGDGGGGPLSKMLENLRRIRATSNNSRNSRQLAWAIPWMSSSTPLLVTLQLGPNFRIGTESYTLNSIAEHTLRMKGNRKSEILLRDVEHLATFASLYKFHKPDYVYPNDKINDCWEKVLLNQFHDVLPGSAIGMVYEDAEKLYAEVRKDGKELLNEAFDALFPSSIRWMISHSSQRKPALSWHNTTFFPRRDIVKVPLVGNASSLRSQVVQASKDGTSGFALMDCQAGGGLSFGTGLYADCTPVSVVTTGADHWVLKNSSVQLTISNGRITSLVDVLERELIPAGQNGGLIIFDDRPNYWDAWDVEIHHLEKFQQLEFSDISYGQSTITTTISLDAIPASMKKGSRSLFVFDAVVDWHQRHEFLKFELPLNIHNDNATYETQFGHVQRPTHKNTTWDMAKFEVCGHKYADLSEFGYGVALLSESKYGFSCRGNILRMSLLRAATAPDAEQDQGLHEFSWAVMRAQRPLPRIRRPHRSLHLQLPSPRALAGRQPRRAATQNETAVPARRRTQRLPRNRQTRAVRRLQRVRERADHARPAAVRGIRGHARLTLRIGSHIPVVRAVLTNLLEDEDAAGAGALDLVDLGEGTGVKLEFHGFEVKTLKLVLGRPA
ncbi:Alpha-mannosidase [Grifola frondosa]|uniref:Alpha-mannosidase n=1 Tax=Grifola frondosa TaxID=5627 RepID=A0A1C7MCM3_GRIFR|nr:Alpha-mannosidase [Grifola frondosa]